MTDISRRSLLLATAAAAGAGAVAGCGDTSRENSTAKSGNHPDLVASDDRIVSATEKKRGGSGHTEHTTLTPERHTIDLGGRTAKTWSFDAGLPGPEIRMTAGDTLAASVRNRLPHATSVHWHGLALRNDMDGVAGLTQSHIAQGSHFAYRFVAPDPGTYWYHSHVGTQRDRGLYGALIIEDPHEPLHYDQEWVLVLDDWLDGVTGTPEQVLKTLRGGMQDMANMSMSQNGPNKRQSQHPSGAATKHGGEHGDQQSRFMLMDAESKLLGGDAGDVAYPLHLINGRAATDPRVHRGKPGQRVRLRIINAAGDTAYRVALAGHTLTVTHTDGYPVQHHDTDALLIGMGERYDAIVTLDDGVFPLVALAEGKNALARALVRTGSGHAPDAKHKPPELTRRVVTASDLHGTAAARLDSRKPDTAHRIRLTGGMKHYDWGFNGRQYDQEHPLAAPFRVSEGERVRLTLTNKTSMWHPIHLHGHTFQMGAAGPRKDTVIVRPGQTLHCELDADNPGRWLTHCHNVYHGESGMMGVLAYRR